MATVQASYNAPAGQNVVTLAGTVQNDAQFTTQPVVDDQVVYPDGVTVDAQLNISGADGSYTLYHVVASTGSTVNENYSISNPDVTAPSLSNATASATGATTADGSVTTDEGNGTLYFLASANASEASTAVKAGNSQSVSASGVQNVSVSGLSEGSQYYLHFLHSDSAGNDSSVSTTSAFTTGSSTETASVQANFTAGASYTTAVIGSGFEAYLFEGWPANEPLAGWQFTALTNDGQFTTDASYTFDVEKVHDFWVTSLDGTVYRQTMDNTGLGQLALSITSVGSNNVISARSTFPVVGIGQTNVTQALIRTSDGSYEVDVTSSFVASDDNNASITHDFGNAPLSTGSYQLQLRITDGTNTVDHNLTINPNDGWSVVEASGSLNTDGDDSVMTDYFGNQPSSSDQLQYETTTVCGGSVTINPDLSRTIDYSALGYTPNMDGFKVRQWTDTGSGREWVDHTAVVRNIPEREQGPLGMTKLAAVRQRYRAKVASRVENYIRNKK